MQARCTVYIAMCELGSLQSLWPVETPMAQTGVHRFLAVLRQVKRRAADHDLELFVVGHWESRKAMNRAGVYCGCGDCGERNMCLLPRRVRCLDFSLAQAFTPGLIGKSKMQSLINEAFRSTPHDYSQP